MHGLKAQHKADMLALIEDRDQQILKIQREANEHTYSEGITSKFVTLHFQTDESIFEQFNINWRWKLNFNGNWSNMK